MGTRKLMTTGWMREEMMKVIELYYFNQNVIERGFNMSQPYEGRSSSVLSQRNIVT